MLPNIGSDQLLQDLAAFLPETLLVVVIVGLLLLRCLAPRAHCGRIALTAVVGLFALNLGLWRSVEGSAPAFAGMLVVDSLTLYARFLLLGAAALTILLTLVTGIPDVEDSADFYVLLLGATLGMLLMTSANHLLLVYLAVEMASVPSYALAGFLKGRRLGSEAALKYVVYGGAASGVMLYGISLLAGRFGTAYLPDLARAYALSLASTTGGFDPLLILATLLILVGLAFKLSAVPFHFWCPDVFEGAAAEVAGFLSVASKAAAFVLTARLVLLLATRESAAHVLPLYFGPALAALAILTATFGNLAAYPQSNLKRLLAYSTITHAGYMLMGVATLSAFGVQALLFYLAVYLFMNLGAFGVVALLRNRTGSEDLRAFRGLVYREPVLVILLGVFLLSLLGLPPLVGFIAKFQIFASVYQAAQSASADAHPRLSAVYLILLAAGCLNTALSAVYYLGVLRVMVLDKPLEEVEGVVPPARAIPRIATAFLGVLAALVLGLGVAWGSLSAASAAGVKVFSREIAPVLPPVNEDPNRPRPQRGMPKADKARTPPDNPAPKREVPPR